MTLEETLAQIKPLDERAMETASKRWDSIAKPLHSLGKMEKMVIQIAGSGGTYPIDALPSYFRGMYIFFPFPYVINAMRECIGGMYENTYLVCMLELAIFGVAALVIGLVIRIPFMKLNEFIEERMEDTEML